MKVHKSQITGSVENRYRYTVLYLDKELVQVGAKSLVNRVDAHSGLEDGEVTMCTIGSVEISKIAKFRSGYSFFYCLMG